MPDKAINIPAGWSKTVSTPATPPTPDTPPEFAALITGRCVLSPDAQLSLGAEAGDEACLVQHNTTPTTYRIYILKAGTNYTDVSANERAPITSDTAGNLVFNYGQVAQGMVAQSGRPLIARVTTITVEGINIGSFTIAP